MTSAMTTLAQFQPFQWGFWLLLVLLIVLIIFYFVYRKKQMSQ